MTRQPEAIALCLASFIPVGASIYDFIAVRIPSAGQGRTTLIFTRSLSDVYRVQYSVDECTGRGRRAPRV